MEYSEFKSLTSKISISPIGGIESQFKLAPKIRKPFSEKFIQKQEPKKAAVLALFYPNHKNETCFILTKRASYKGTHSAQISFPGGKFDISDESLENTALRETHEEIGILKKEIIILKEMTDVYIPPSNFLVTPFLGYANKTPNFKTNNEVEALIPVSLNHFLNNSILSTTTLSTSYAKNMVVPCFKLNSYIVWGATAMMLNEIRELLKNI